MADEASRRRELRRRRILENAEERKKKIFGTSNIDVDATKEENVKPAAPDLQDSTQVPSSKVTLNCEGESVNNVPHIQDTRTLPTLNTKELQNSPRFDKGESDDAVEFRPAPNFFRAENGVESVPEITEHLRNINHLLTASASSGLTASPPGKINNDVQSSSVIGGLSTPIVPVVLALLVCVLLSVNLGYVVSNSIALPFLLWEAHHLWCCRHVIEAMSRGVGGLLGLALVLCGLQQSLMSKLTQIITVMKCVFEDFAFYILTIVVWYCFVGLPGSVSSMNEYSEPETVRVTATHTNEEDMFDHLEEF